MNTHIWLERKRWMHRAGRRAGLLGLSVGLAGTLTGGTAGAQSYGMPPGGYGSYGGYQNSFPGGMPGQMSMPGGMPDMGEGPQGHQPPSGEIMVPVKTYKLGPGDVLRVTLENWMAYSQPSVMVPADGMLVLPNFGPGVQANGKTIAQVQEELRKGMAQRIINPRVVVTLVQPRSTIIGYVYVQGEVNAPGTTQIRKGYRLTELLSQVGGLRGRPEELEAYLTHPGPGQKPIKLDLHQAISYTHSKANMAVQPDDNLLIRSIDPRNIVVTGDVLRPGPYAMHVAPHPGAQEVPLKPTLVDALVAAGLPQNPLDKDAGTSFTGFLLRHNQKIPLQVTDAMHDKNGEANITLQPDDYIDIALVRPIPPLNVWVNGEVKAPGTFAMPPGTGVLEAVAQAGGLNLPLEKINTTILRAGTAVPIKLDRALLGDPGANIPLQANDLVQVSETDFIHVQIAGQVTKPDAYHIKPGAHLLDVISGAGGLTLKPEEAAIAVLRTLPNGNQKVLNIDPIALVTLKDLSQNMILEDGDLVSVTAANNTRFVYVSGEVNKPDRYDVAEGDGLIELITRAGGVLDDAALTRVTVNRKGQAQGIVIDAYDAIRRGQPLKFPLQDGDIVAVPRNPNQVLVMGAVNKPGTVPIPEKETLTVTKALGIAGGTSPLARTQEIAVLRRLASGVVENHVLDFTKIKSGSLDFDIPLKSGDILYVPMGKVTQSKLQTLMRFVPLAGTFGLLP